MEEIWKDIKGYEGRYMISNKKWDSQSDAARFYNKKPGNINNCVRGRNKTYLGYVWREEP